MGKEIERKFLVTGNAWRTRAEKAHAIRQVYLASTRSISVRVRIIGKQKAYITLKGPRKKLERLEFEYPIPVADARQLMKLRTGSVIEKRRHIVKAGGRRFEIDVFKGDHKGLILAELELPSERARFERPVWLGKEVTQNRRYHNATLARQTTSKKGPLRGKDR